MGNVSVIFSLLPNIQWLNYCFVFWQYAAPARLPSFHTCVGANEERLTPKWYNEHGNQSSFDAFTQIANFLWELFSE